MPRYAWNAMNEQRIHTHSYTHVRMLAYTLCDSSGWKQASQMLAEPWLRGALFSSGGKLLRQKQRKVCERRGGWRRVGRGRKSGPQIRRREEEQRENKRCVDTVMGWWWGLQTRSTVQYSLYCCIQSLKSVVMEVHAPISRFTCWEDSYISSGY